MSSNNGHPEDNGDGRHGEGMNTESIVLLFFEYLNFWFRFFQSRIIVIASCQLKKPFNKGPKLGIKFFAKRETEEMIYIS